MFDYVVSIGEAHGFGSGDGGHEFEASLSEVVIDRKLGENDLEILKLICEKEQLFFQLELNQKFWAHDRNQQVCGGFLNLMILMLLWVSANIKEWNAFCATMCNKKR